MNKNEILTVRVYMDRRLHLWQESVNIQDSAERNTTYCGMLTPRRRAQTISNFLGLSVSEKYAKRFKKAFSKFCNELYPKKVMLKDYIDFITE